MSLTIAQQVKRRLSEIDHQIRMAGYREQTDSIKAGYKNLRRLGEQLSLTLKTSRLKRAMSSSAPLSVKDAASWQRIVVETSGIVEDSVRVARWREHAETWGRQRGIALCWEATPTVNAYANTAAKWIESAPIVGEESYADFQHEKGHHERPCRPTHRRVTVSKDRTCCPRCEIDAWMFAQQDALEWTRRMHDEMVTSIGTYVPYATSAERAEIHTLCSGLSFRRVQLQKAMK